MPLNPTAAAAASYSRVLWGWLSFSACYLSVSVVWLVRIIIMIILHCGSWTIRKRKRRKKSRGHKCIAGCNWGKRGKKHQIYHNLFVLRQKVPNHCSCSKFHRLVIFLAWHVSGNLQSSNFIAFLLHLSAAHGLPRLPTHCLSWHVAIFFFIYTQIKNGFVQSSNKNALDETHLGCMFFIY